MLARRRLWFEGQAGLAPERLIFIDETGASMKMARLRGWSRKGERCRAAKVGSRNGVRFQYPLDVCLQD